jgi:acyl-coenzyme A synthetase/AMP-(fatty) acid ligase
VASAGQSGELFRRRTIPVIANAKLLRHEIGAIASPDAIQWAPGLPKTRSGKIMRRILRKIAVNETDGLGDCGAV